MKYLSKVFSDQLKLKRLIAVASLGKYSGIYLAKCFKCNKKTIYRVLKQNNIILRNLGRFQKKIYLKDNFFDKLSPVSAYWLGFIAADGTLSERNSGVIIGLNVQDAGHLRKFVKAIKTNAKICYVKGNNSARVGIYSKAIFGTLVKLGITPNKSLTIDKVRVPNSLIRHFIRGVFDGDGWISGKRITHLQIGIAGNKLFLERIQKTLEKECKLNKVKLYKLYLENKAYKLQYTGSQIFKILDYLYRYSTYETRLERKYIKALEFRKTFCNRII